MANKLTQSLCELKDPEVLHCGVLNHCLILNNTYHLYFYYLKKSFKYLKKNLISDPNYCLLYKFLYKLHHQINQSINIYVLILFLVLYS